jgi:hypothetical protein
VVEEHHCLHKDHQHLYLQEMVVVEVVPEQLEQKQLLQMLELVGQDLLLLMLL